MSAVIPVSSDAPLSPEAEARREYLIARITEPDVFDSLLTLAGHADLIAMMVSSIDALLRRSDDISDSLVSGIDELKSALAAPDGPLSGIDVDEITSAFRAMADLGKAMAPAVEAVNASGLVSPTTTDAAIRFGTALTTAEQGHQHGRTPGTFRQIISGLRDPDVRRGVGYLLTVTKSLGSDSISQQSR